jgi:hypothetical protein
MINQNKEFLTIEEFREFIYNKKEIMRIFVNQYYLECLNEGRYSILS